MIVSRTLLACFVSLIFHGFVFGQSASQNGWWLTINGTSQADSLAISGSGVAGEIHVDFDGDGIIDQKFSGVGRVDVETDEGDDRVDVTGPLALLDSTSSADSMIGVFGFGGSNRIRVMGDIDCRRVTLNGAPYGGGPGSDSILVEDASFSGTLALVAEEAGSVASVRDTSVNGQLTFHGTGGNVSLLVEEVVCGEVVAFVAPDAAASAPVLSISETTVLGRTMIEAFGGGYIWPTPPGNMDLSIVVSKSQFMGSFDLDGSPHRTDLRIENSVEIAGVTVIDTHEGSDSVRITGTVRFDDDVTITTGQRADDVEITGDVVFAGNLTLSTNQGADEVTIDGLKSFASIGGNFTMDTGTHSDLVEINLLKVGYATTLTTGHGWDTVKWNAAIAGEDWSIDMGNGEDDLIVTGSCFFATVQFSGGNHFDTGYESGNTFAVPYSTVSFEAGNLQ